jgi:hypothetical protein
LFFSGQNVKNEIDGVTGLWIKQHCY